MSRLVSAVVTHMGVDGALVHHYLDNCFDMIAPDITHFSLLLSVKCFRRTDAWFSIDMAVVLYSAVWYPSPQTEFD